MFDVHPLIMGMLVLLGFRMGYEEGASKWLKDMIERRAITGRTSAVELAIGFIGARRYDEAVRCLEQSAFEEGDPLTMWFHIFPPLRHLRGHREFQSLLKRINLPSPTA